MTADDYAIRVKDVSKIYHLWDSRSDRLVFPLKRLVSSILPSVYAKPMSDKHNGYREFHALRNISLDIKKGESWGFIGVNGSGKSTLLKIISGNLLPSAGRVEVDGRVVILDYGSGFNGEFTGKENIYIKATIMGLSRRQINQRFKSIVDFAELGDFINQPVRTYSSGMISRLGFSIMAHVDADIIITDEALAVGDIFFVQKCMKFIRSFLKKGTFLFVSHSMNDVMSLCQNAVWLESGNIRAIGSASDVAWAYLDNKDLVSTNSNLSNEERDPVLVEDENRLKLDARLSQPAISQLMNSKMPKKFTDMRLKYPNISSDRNDIHVIPSELNIESSVDGVDIFNVELNDESGSTCTCVVGSEMVVLKVDILSKRQINIPIVGFQVLDRLGQILFADNSSFVTQVESFSVLPGQVFSAEFTFQMPLLPPGDYVFRVAVASGKSADQAVMLRVVENALVLHSVASGVRYGLIGVPMQEIALKRKFLENELV